MIYTDGIGAVRVAERECFGSVEVASTEGQAVISTRTERMYGGGGKCKPARRHLEVSIDISLGFGSLTVSISVGSWEL